MRRQYERQGEIIISPAKLTLRKQLKKVYDNRQIRESLSIIKGEVPEDEFKNTCQSFGVSPDEIDCLYPQRGETKQARCESFLRVLFTCRPEGLPVNQTLEIGKSEGFGENMVREVANKMGIKQEWKMLDGVRASYWIPPVEE